MKIRGLLLIGLLVVLASAAPAATASVSSSPFAAPDAPASTQTVMSEGFEGTWPGPLWTVSDLSNDGFQRYWGKTSYKPHSGTFSAWPAAAGANAVTPPSIYPDNLNTRMVYGPIDLSNAFSAQWTFWLWLDTEVNFGDSIWFGVSRDGVIYDQAGLYEGQLDWTQVSADLAPYVGDDSVWIRWDFYSDGSVGAGGAYVDDVAVSAVVLDAPAVTISRSGTDIRLDWPSNPDAGSYEVWWGNNTPYFTPGSDCAGTPSSCSVQTKNFYIHKGAGGSTANNYSYVVKAVKGSTKSFPSNRTGEFDFALTRGQ